MPRPKPTIIEEGNFYVIRDFEIGLFYGLGAIRAIGSFYKEIERYNAKEKVFIQKRGYSASFGDPVEVLGGEFVKGSRVTIKVSKNLGGRAKELLIRLYNGLTSRTIYPDFEGGDWSLKDPSDEELFDIWRRY